MTDEPDIATHSSPAWSRPSSFLLFADLAQHGLPGRWEQLRTSQLSAEQFLICSIPFFTYGIALGDVVSAGERAGKGWIIDRVISRSGHRTVRVAVESRERAHALHEQLHEAVARTGLAHEWHGSGYLVIDVPPDRRSQDIPQLFQEHLDRGELIAELDE